MPVGIAITNTDHTVDDARGLARNCKDARQARCLRAIARVMEGASRRHDCAPGAGRPADAVHWIHHGNTRRGRRAAGPSVSGRASKLDAEQNTTILWRGTGRAGHCRHDDAVVGVAMVPRGNR